MRWLLLLSIAVAACGGENVEPTPPPGSGTGGGGDGGAGGAGGAEPQPPGEPMPIAVSQWMVAKVSANGDQILPAVEDGSFALPPEGSYLGTSWKPVVPGDAGVLEDAFTDYLYAAAEIEVPAGHRAFARGDTVVAFYVDNARRYPGDFYHSKKMRVPLGVGEGKHLVLVRALGRRNTPEVELWSTDAEVVLNPADLTFPTFVVGATETMPLGVATLLLGEEAAPITATVLENDVFAETTVSYASLAPDALTQISFSLEPKAPIADVETLPVTLRIDSPSLDWTYEETIDIETRAPGEVYRATRRSKVDGSTQYYAVNPPSSPGADKGLILSLHGASVEAEGQGQAYGAKDWAYVIAPTNRRPFGFDWEEWGRLDAIEALDHALSTFAIDTSRVHLTGHSMGGHGSWHVGVHFTDRFGVIAPSAGWISFEKYGGPAHPTGPIGAARGASETLDFVDNLAGKTVYIIHGSADSNVPVSHAQEMFTTLGPLVTDLTYHEEPGADHWWDLDDTEPGADCVDWEPMISVMEQATVEATPLDFSFVTPGAWVSSTRSFVTLRSCTSPMATCRVDSSAAGDTITLTTDNVRALTLDGARLAQAGIATAIVDGQSHTVTSAPIAVGPQDGKHPAQHGPLNQAFHRPFCFIWDDDGPQAYRDYAAWLLSWWSVIGNGHGCGAPLSRVDEVSAEHNLVYLGVPSAEIGGDLPFSWDGTTLTVGGNAVTDGALAFVHPDGDHLAAYVAATTGSEYLLFRYTPFSSRAGMPDFLSWGPGGIIATGFFDPTWNLDPAYATGL